MKKMAVVSMMCLAGMLSSWANGALISDSVVDRMHSDSEANYWFAKSGTNAGCGTHWLHYADPNDPTESWSTGYELSRNDANNFWWSYQTAEGKTFNRVQISVLRRFYGETYSMEYKVAGGSSVLLAPTNTQTFSSDWGDGQLYTYDFTSLGLTPKEVKFTIGFYEAYQPMISSVKLDVVPEPATLGLLAFGGLLLRKRR